MDDKRSEYRYRRDDKKEDRYKREDKTEERAVERSKERSKDRWMRMRGDKRPSRKHDRKVLVAEESTKSWADTDSKSSSSSSSSSDSEQEEVRCLMADQTSDDEVFDFSNVEFTRENLVSALNDMVKEYSKLSHSFEEAKAENRAVYDVCTIWNDAKFALTLCDLPLGGAGFTAYELAEIQKEILLPLKKLMTVEIEDYT
ncbi:hypothetical protein F511_17270 [Dorcoceras hygrometricum]|uniref:Uncharacterized protein n=1 Tax=Dorcoceras hygrometricum TaxID=472368 RepID=A0A2Z7D3I6_9LAMI|nr:hypothetical protein F511_17270 [Dorcoceras hygrometricum]